MPRLAIILGASIAGILSAKALSPYFDEIILLERDELPTQPAHRSGTAQAQHAHILLRRGLLGLEKIFPRFAATLSSAGGVLTNATQDWYTLFPMGAFPNFPSTFEFVCASRPLLEHTLRSMLLAQCSNVSIRANCNVTGVTLSESMLPSVTVTTDNVHENLPASLVIDSTGRNSHAPNWLNQQSFGTVKQIQVKPYLGYATRIYSNVHMPDGVRATVVMAKDPEMTRGGVLFPIENGQYICTLYGFSQDYPPTMEAEFLNFAKSLRSDIIYKAIVQATPETELKAFVKKESTFHLYAQQGAWPKGFLVTGDAVCSFNPIYGQGITAALLATEALGRHFAGNDPSTTEFAKLAQRKIVQAFRAPWTISTNEDLRWPATTGMKNGSLLKAMHQFSNLIGKAATRDEKVAYAYIDVLHMTASPTALLTPMMLARILKSGLR